MQSIANSTRTFMKAQTEPKKPKKPRKKPSLKLKLPKASLAWWLVLILIAVSIFLFFQYQEAKHTLQTPSAAANTRQVNDVVAKVRKLAVVPTNETPTVATVKNAEKIKQLPYFANAHDGDKVLVFSKQKQAVIYRPSTNQVVAIFPTSDATSTSATPAPAQ